MNSAMILKGIEISGFPWCRYLLDFIMGVWIGLTVVGRSFVF